jgi:hypothetical protein
MYAMTSIVRLVSSREWPKHRNTGLAEVIGVSRYTARAWNLGANRMPEKRLRQLEAYLRNEAAALTDLADRVALAAKQEARRIKRRRCQEGDHQKRRDDKADTQP